MNLFLRKMIFKQKIHKKLTIKLTNNEMLHNINNLNNYMKIIFLKLNLLKILQGPINLGKLENQQPEMYLKIVKLDLDPKAHWQIKSYLSPYNQPKSIRKSNTKRKCLSIPIHLTQITGSSNLLLQKMYFILLIQKNIIID